MNNHTDQERDPFASKLNSITESLLETANTGLKNALGQIETLRVENARLVAELELARAQQPASVAVPDECPHLIVFDDTDRPNEIFAGAGARPAALRRFQQISGSWNAHLFVRVDGNSRDDRCPSAMLAAAPHPVSGEQKPAAQDVSGLVNALEQIIEQFPFGLDRQVFRVNGGAPLQADDDTEFLSYKKTNHIAGVIRSTAVEALSAHRAQAQGGDV